jgi:hypothetical protein
VAERPGEMDERDVDERFASIVARWEGPVPVVQDGAEDPEDPTAHTGDAAAPDAATEAPDPQADTGPAAVTRPAWVNPSPLDVVLPASSWRTAPPADDDTRAAASAAEAELEEEHFEPPDVTLPPQEDLHFWGAVIGLVAGPLMLLYVVFARPFYSTRWFAASVAVSLLGFALLVLRQPTTRDEHDCDDGARL